jgi:tetratricopeptide (TPR) repeat protein
VASYKQAEALYVEATSPLATDAQAALGQIHFELEEYAEAKEYLELVYAQLPDHPQVNLLLGFCYLELGEDLSAAVKYLRRAQELGVDIQPGLRGALSE